MKIQLRKNIQIMVFQKTFLFFGFFFLLFFIFCCNSQQSSDIFKNPFQNIEELAITSDNCILEGRHLWVSNEIQTVNPDFNGIGGISAIYSPPLNLSPFQLETQFFNQKVEPSRYEWKPGEIIEEAVINGINIKCLLVPVFPEARVIQLIELSNSNQESVTIPVKISANPSFSYDSIWAWSPKNASEVATVKENGNANVLCFETADGEISIHSDHSNLIKAANKLAGEIQLKPDCKIQFAVTVSYKGKTDADKLDDSNIHADELISQSRKRWNDRIEYAYKHLGRIETSNPEFDLFYKRGILSLLTGEWNKKELLFQPYFSESGIDGGAVCTYLWGLAYVSKIMPLYNSEAWKQHIVQAIKTDAENHYAFTPITGEGIGPWYSYNQYSMVRTIYDYVLVTGDRAFLSEKVNNKRVIDYCVDQALYKDDIATKVKLINYGTNHNLLELKKTETYQFFVPSPNAERCWSYRAVDELCDLAKVRSLNLSNRADDLAKLITKELWSEGDKWFLTVDTVGKRHFSPSIQIFDMLRCGVLSKEQEANILCHLNENEFISQYGVHSLSKQDLGYDLNDADWGGPGVYSGDAPELIEDLINSGYPVKAEDVMKRILWWGKYLPYYPQAIVADNIDYRRNGRANVVAGVASAQSVLFGVLGLQFSPDGKVSIKPEKTTLFDNFYLDGLLIKGKSTCISIKGNTISVKVAGEDVVAGEFGQRIYFHEGI